jgi:hypothetical protein
MQPARRQIQRSIEIRTRKDKDNERRFRACFLLLKPTCDTTYTYTYIAHIFSIRFYDIRDR